MSGTLKVDCAVLESAVGQMNSAHTEFNTMTENGFGNETAFLDGMNSDFVDKLTRVLEITGDKNLSKLNENIMHYVAEAQTIYEEIKKADEALVGEEG